MTEKRPDVTLVGIGALGSFMAMALCKDGWEVLAADPDVVEEHNVRNQVYSIDDVGKHKVAALEQYCAGNLQMYEGYANLRATGSTSVVICTPDDMQTRRLIWNQAKGSDRLLYYMEARGGGEVLYIYAVNPRDEKAVKAYERTFDGEIQKTALCGIGPFCGMMVAGYMVAALRDLRTQSGEMPSWQIMGNVLATDMFKSSLAC